MVSPHKVRIIVFSNQKWKALEVMGKIVLYHMAISPPCRAVIIVANAIGVELELKELSLLKGEHMTPEFLKINPQRTIPVIDDNGVFIYDSHAIITYLCNKYAKDDKLYPKDWVKRANVDARLHFDSSYLYARLYNLYGPVYAGATELPQDKIEYVAKCWPLMENFLQNGKYLCGDELTLADYSCMATVSSVIRIIPIIKNEYPKLFEWIERMGQDKFFSAVKGAKEHHQLILDTLKANKEK